MNTENNKPIIINLIEEKPNQDIALTPAERANRKEVRRLVNEIVQMGRMNAVIDVVGRS